jgi:glycosyltransferase involved in cell wall biosynthesis
VRLDVVIPAHNEEKRIGRTLRAYRVRCADADTRFIVALDRCTDRTVDVVREHMMADDRVDMLQYPKLGKGGVLMEAFRTSDAELIGFTDSSKRPDRLMVRSQRAITRRPYCQRNGRSVAV